MDQLTYQIKPQTQRKNNAMIEKFLAIQNIGKFSKFNIKKGDWNGVLAKNNIIYAPNGSGKTTLSLIFKSLKDSPKLLEEKTTFPDQRHANGDQKISLRANGETFDFQHGNWNKHFPSIEVFNIHFIEETLFSWSAQPRKNQLNLFDYLSSPAITEKNIKLSKLVAKRQEISKEIQKIKNLARKSKITKEDRVNKLSAIETERLYYAEKISEANKEMGLESQIIFQKFVERVNYYLSKFSRSLRLEKFSKELDQRTTFYLQFGENRVTFDSRKSSHQFRYTLSEGDKNAFSISVFLAKISCGPDPKDLTIIFDDPLSSLDSGRRHLTIKELSKLSNKISQLIVLTHDASFAAELEREIRGEVSSLELISTNAESWLKKRKHQEEHITGLFLDIKTLTDFKKNGAEHQSDRRDIVRCLRPTLEGFIRIKYYDTLTNSQWLGDFIGLIRSSTEKDELYRLKTSEILDNICDVNDYSKSYHHSNPDQPDQFIDEHELSIMVDTTLKLIKTL